MRAIVVHAEPTANKPFNWRSNITHDSMLKLLKDRGFEIVDSFLEWQDDGTTHQAGLYKDVITVFRRGA